MKCELNQRGYLLGKKCFEKFNRFIDSLLSLTATLTGVMVVFLIISVCYEVVCRYFFNRPTSWVADVGSFILLFLPFMVTGWVLKNDTHVRIDLLYDRLGIRNKIIFDAFTSFLAIIVCFILVLRGTGIVVELFNENIYTDTTMHVVQWPFMAVIPFGILLFLVEYVRKFLRAISLLTGKNRGEIPKRD